ncbi:MAG: hypothetical protein HY314_10200 [Acidobacteria bacterium]|nr:hypothetical protein [Acidobacteriota bacterium]
MRDAETILGIIRERGRGKLPLEDIYRQLYNRHLYLRAYRRLYRNHGAMTPTMLNWSKRCPRWATDSSGPWRNSRLINRLL